MRCNPFNSADPEAVFPVICRKGHVGDTVMIFWTSGATWTFLNFAKWCWLKDSWVGVSYAEAKNLLVFFLSPDNTLHLCSPKSSVEMSMASHSISLDNLSLHHLGGVFLPLSPIFILSERWKDQFHLGCSGRHASRDGCCGIDWRSLVWE